MFGIKIITRKKFDHLTSECARLAIANVEHAKAITRLTLVNKQIADVLAETLEIWVNDGGKFNILYKKSEE